MRAWLAERAYKHTSDYGGGQPHKVLALVHRSPTSAEIWTAKNGEKNPATRSASLERHRPIAKLIGGKP